MKQFIYWLFQPLVRYNNRRAARQAVIDINSKCPACGHYQGKLKMILAGISNGAGVPHVQHTCTICEAQWYEETIMAVDKWWKDPRVK